MRALLFLIAFTFGCEQNIAKKETCSLQGFHDLKSKRISCEDNLVVSTVEFSNGISRKLVQGTVKLNSKKYPFTLVLYSTEVVQHTFPFVELDSAKYKCTIQYISSKMIEIEWKTQENRLFLRKEFISAR